MIVLRTPLVWPLLVLVAAAGASFAQPAELETARLVTAPEKLVELGVGSYRLELGDSTAEVDLLTPESNYLGDVHVSWNVHEGSLVEISVPSADLLLFFHPLGRELRLTDLRSEEVATGRLTDDGWQLDDASRALLERYASEIAMLSEIHDDVYENYVDVGGVWDELNFVESPHGPVGENIFNQCPPTCNGSTVRGSNWASLSRSACCYAAKQNAHTKCWNQYCTGCCFFYSCDANCALGDYLCAPCGITGRRCSGWPSDCCT